MAIRVQRHVLAEMLRSHGEDELAERSASLSDDELARIGRLGAYYAWSEDAMKLGISLGGARALSSATIDVLEETGRGLRRYSTDAERAQGFPRAAVRARVGSRTGPSASGRRETAPAQAG
jgi:hypothetical protein